MNNNIHLIYNDDEQIIDNFNQNDFKLNNLYDLIGEKFVNVKKSYNNYDIYLKVDYGGEIYELYINNQEDLDEIININKKKEITIYILDNDKSFNSINKKNNIDSIVDINQTKTNYLSEIYKMKYDQNNKISIEKNKIINSNGFKHSFKLIKYGKEIPNNSFLWCIPDNNEIFFLPSKNYRYIHEEDNDIYYIVYDVYILFKNNKSIKTKVYKLNYQLFDDKEGVIGDEKGTFFVQIIDK